MLNEDAIEIIVPCGQNSDKYLAHFMTTALETWSGLVPISFSIGVNNCPSFDRSLAMQFSKHVTVRIQDVNTDTEPGSLGHGLVLTHLFNQCLAKYCMVADCDIAMLKRDWDLHLIDKLNEKTVIVGTEYYPFSNLPKYVGFPALVVALFETQLVHDHSLHFMPHENKGAHVIKTHDEEIAYGRKIGESVYLDVGFDFPRKLRPKGFNGLNLKFTKPTVLGSGQEFHLDGSPFLTHLKGSSVIEFSHSNAQSWANASKNYNLQTGQNVRKLS